MTEGQTDQFKAIDLADGFHEHDMAALADWPRLRGRSSDICGNGYTSTSMTSGSTSRPTHVK